jgi:hypothetical protein
VSRCRSCTICVRCWTRCSRCCARVSICSFRDGRAPAAGDVLDGVAMRGPGCLVIAGCCGGAARWISGRGAAMRGAAGRGGAAMRGAACGIMAGRCGAGAARNAGAAGRAMAGGAAGRAMAGGGPAGRAAGAAAPPGPWPLICWANEPVLTAIADTPRKSAVTRTPRGSMIATPCFVARKRQRARAEIVRLGSMTCISILRRRAGAIRRTLS